MLELLAPAGNMEKLKTAFRFLPETLPPMPEFVLKLLSNPDNGEENKWDFLNICRRMN